MLELAYRYDRIFLTFAAVAILSSAVNYSVIAQDKHREYDTSTYRIKLALANLPPTAEPPRQTGENYKLNINSEQASFTVSNHKNLLVSFLDSVKSSTMASRLVPVAVPEPSQIAYNPAPITPPTPDKASWENQIKRRYKNGYIRTVAPGVKHITMRKAVGGRTVTMNIVEINPSLDNRISIEPVLAGHNLNGKAQVRRMVSKNDALIGINASFFKQSTGTPLGTMVINEELLTGPIFNRVSLGIGDKEFRMAKISLNGRVIAPDNSEIKLDNVNQPRMLASYTIIYSDKWGKKAPLSPKYGKQVQIQNNEVIGVSAQQLSIPEKGYVIVGPQKNLDKLKVGDKVQIKFETDPNWTGIKHVISGGPYLVRNGVQYVDIKEQRFGSIAGRNPRTAVGYTKDNTFIMIAIDGRIRSSAGVTLWELSKIMKDFGCYNAMNLDGGSSTQMIVKNRIVNIPLNRGGAYVSNGLVVRMIDKNDTQISEVAQ